MTTPAGLATRLAELVDFRNDGPNRLVIAARFECGVANAVFTPSEVVWSSDDGDSVLVHLPELVTSAINSEAWPSTLANVSPVALAQTDGSDPRPERRLVASRGRARRAAPRSRAAPAPPREVARHPANALADADRPQVRHRPCRVEARGALPGRGRRGGRFPSTTRRRKPGRSVRSIHRLSFVRPLNVTVAFEEAYTAHLGAQPSPREVQLGELTPTPWKHLSYSHRLAQRVLSESRNPAIYGRPRRAAESSRRRGPSLHVRQRGVRRDRRPRRRTSRWFESRTTRPTPARR